MQQRNKETTDALPPIANGGSLLIDWIDAEGRVCLVNDHEARELGIDRRDLPGLSLERIYSSSSAQLLRAIAAGEHVPAASFPVWLSTPHYEEVPMVASAVPDLPRGLAIVKQPLSSAALGIGEELLERVEILSQMIGAATEACWCIEFLEPVDTALAEDEIVERIFSNQSCWRACNEAMARLYRVPEGLDFNVQPVSRYFPATEINRQMVRDLVRSNYRLDHAAAVDRRHDGSEMLVENDFRAAIKDGFLVRLWGTTRDIGAHKRREQQLADRADTMQDILSAAPDPILVISEDGLLLAANPAAEDVWGRTAEQILGRPIQHFMETRQALGKLRQAALEGEDGESGCDLTVVAANGSRDVWRFRAARIEGEMRRYVLTARRKAKRKARSPAQEALA
ncbi:PAS domain-containing protein [Shinella sp. HZN7]|uniref:PAS domain-containing protein n=1 Tax=Shinella sp. (strain HZN7) TaxID=879274 RepID=UPI0007DA7B0D|nr:PAS domain-containing protein [Shinella sp. HZN7]ANH05535.1 hypothetical protein shn_16790 [Shinella sp. HZN7]